MSKIKSGYRFTFLSSDINHENCYSIVKDGLTKLEADLFFDISEAIEGGTCLDMRFSNSE